ncbi:TPA: recombinase family protein [Acinetobacter baumannii]|uniref:Recombinase family protein n=1 Tax=Acinetobacter baumannii TaxID=470 RepID=A0A646LV11_ACIBA|nr:MULTISPECIES: recombinase family protein [Acinetobacter calcoaceticus/baumannii complex]EHU3033142.1 recombinase family protein [Acinetobacter baumannii]EHZ7962029.1 recombinase family protein [Acinetobacter baumannii]EIB7144048.1 recombinase family protein [Acinetobacter baumannii]EKA78402.1 resolvase, N-terminal domain protein [Acinetobacter baumannii IS-58]EKK06749.1 resolvase, N-terminal domain protein [Acinetobacter baumannii IS-235]
MQHPEDDQTLDIISYIEEKPAHGQTVGYIRVSTTDQNTIRQLDGVELNKTFVDKISGSTGIKDRPELKKLFEYVRAGDTVVIHSFDRLARDLNILISLIQQLNDKGVALKSIKEDITFNGANNAMDKFILHIFGAVAEFQKSLIAEARQEGINKRKKLGLYEGRKPSLSEEQQEALRARIKEKNSSMENYKKIKWSAVAKEFKVSEPTLMRYIKKLS